MKGNVPWLVGSLLAVVVMGLSTQCRPSDEICVAEEEPESNLQALLAAMTEFVDIEKTAAAEISEYTHSNCTLVEVMGDARQEAEWLAVLQCRGSRYDRTVIAHYREDGELLAVSLSGKIEDPPGQVATLVWDEVENAEISCPNCLPPIRTGGNSIEIPLSPEYYEQTQVIILRTEKGECRYTGHELEGKALHVRLCDEAK